MSVMAQNPIIRHQFTADPTARIFNNKVYVYGSHDIVPPEGQRRDWFSMADYHVFSSQNLTEWTDHGVIVRQEDVPWGKPDGYSMWAPDCVQKNGKYYFYFPDAPRDGRGFAIGVATADSPEGPFRLEPEAIKGVSGIDPCVLIDDDGQAYIYWSGMGIRGCKLKDNMLELDGELKEMKMPKREGMPDMPSIMVGGARRFQGGSLRLQAWRLVLSQLPLGARLEGERCQPHRDAGLRHVEVAAGSLGFQGHHHGRARQHLLDKSPQPDRVSGAVVSVLPP